MRFDRSESINKIQYEVLVKKKLEIAKEVVKAYGMTKYITVEEAARLLDVTADTVRKAIKRGRIVAQKRGPRVYFVDKQSVLEYRKTRRGGGQTKPKT